MERNEHYCQSSIVKQSDDGTYSYLAITNDHVQHSSAYTTELIAEEVALRYSNGIVHTDCQSAIKALERMSAKGHPLIQLAHQTKPPAYAR